MTFLRKEISAKLSLRIIVSIGIIIPMPTISRAEEHKIRKIISNKNFFCLFDKMFNKLFI